LNEREIVYLDIAFDEVSQQHEMKKEEEPKTFHSIETGRGPLGEDWQKTHKPIMCIYKVAKVEFKYWGFQNKVEQFIHKTMVRDIMLLGHKQAFCWIDEWYGLSIPVLRKYEQETQSLLDKLRNGEKVDISLAPKQSSWYKDFVQQEKRKKKTQKESNQAEKEVKSKQKKNSKFRPITN